MGTPVKALGNQEKHLTVSERSAREAAEAALQRDAVKLQKPKALTSAAGKYWNSLIKRAEAVDLLDDLDAEMLAGYCSMLARRDQLSALTDKLLAAALESDTESLSSDETDKLDGLIGKLEKLDRLLLSYADKLGFTPQGRVRLAQKRAAAAQTEDPDGDLF